MSSNGRCFDIGNTVRAALAQFQETGHPNHCDRWRLRLLGKIGTQRERPDDHRIAHRNGPVIEG